jgi:hypothetical protein
LAINLIGTDGENIVRGNTILRSGYAGINITGINSIKISLNILTSYQNGIQNDGTNMQLMCNTMRSELPFPNYFAGIQDHAGSISMGSFAGNNLIEDFGTSVFLNKTNALDLRLGYNMLGFKQSQTQSHTYNNFDLYGMLTNTNFNLLDAKSNLWYYPASDLSNNQPKNCAAINSSCSSPQFNIKLWDGQGKDIIVTDNLPKTTEQLDCNSHSGD